MHQRAFALQGGADAVSATLWPLSVDGLLLLATVGLLNSARGAERRVRAVVWLAFLLGIAVSFLVSRCRWRRMWRLRLRWSGSRCWWRAGLRLLCCSRWNCSRSAAVESAPRVRVVRRRLPPRLPTAVGRRVAETRGWTPRERKTGRIETRQRWVGERRARAVESR
ncbi:DUF2637 domain-containing protein [Streptomyces albicerus]|uniref:DUF2637 domain-containing protein n=1 Tax=Streptomyces albicerus TaxID=2569859 RepID=UPI0021F24392|nr:DUF2637 domain-containing protein [Streptomyces albicerus]